MAKYEILYIIRPNIDTFAASPLKPFLISVIPATSQILVPVGRHLADQRFGFAAAGKQRLSDLLWRRHYLFGGFLVDNWSLRKMRVALIGIMRITY